MVHIPQKNLKILAIDLRKKGFSYSEIQSAALVPKSTLSLWLKDVKLSETELRRLELKRTEARIKGSKTRILKTAKAIEEIRSSSSKDIKEISKRELWLIGIMLYWKERFLRENEADLQKGVSFTSSDPFLIKLFLKWLLQVGGLGNQDIRLDIFVEEQRKSEIDKIIDYWSRITGFHQKSFSRVYFQKNKEKKGKRKIVRKSNYGLLRIRVKASSMLARQISGWIKGIQETLVY